VGHFYKASMMDWVFSIMEIPSITEEHEFGDMYVVDGAQPVNDVVDTILQIMKPPSTCQSSL